MVIDDLQDDAVLAYVLGNATGAEALIIEHERAGSIRLREEIADLRRGLTALDDPDALGRFQSVIVPAIPDRSAFLQHCGERWKGEIPGPPRRQRPQERGDG